MSNTCFLPIKKAEYHRLLSEKAIIVAARKAGVYPEIINKMISLYRAEVAEYKQAYPE